MADEAPIRSAQFNQSLDEEFSQYVDEHGMSNSEALRVLVRKGLEHENDNTADDQKQPAGIGYHLTGWSLYYGMLFVVLGVFSVGLLRVFGFALTSDVVNTAIALAVFGAAALLFGAVVAVVDVAHQLLTSAASVTEAFRNTGRGTLTEIRVRVIGR